MYFIKSNIPQSFFMGNTSKSKHYLLINGIEFQLITKTSVESCVPFYRYQVKSKFGIPWRPAVDPSTLPTEFSWFGDEDKIPNALITKQGPSVSCRLFDREKGEVYNYGDKIYLLRGGCCCNSGDKQQNIIPGGYYVGEAVRSLGSDPKSVVFKYENGFLTPLSCEVGAVNI
jgi:hypothetical protein